jgi:hypothetical protein
MLSGTQLGTSYVTNPVLERLLHGSHALEELDIGGSRVTVDGLIHISEVLYASFVLLLTIYSLSGSTIHR